MNLIEKTCRKILYSKLSGLTEGFLEFEEAFLKGHSKVHSFGNPGSSLKARLRILNPDAYPKMVFSGSVGAGEAYFLNEWDCSDLTSMIRILLKNREILESIDHGISAIQNPLQKIYHGLNRNTVKGAKKNIEAHYDLGNDFFELFLDPSFLYSSAIFRSPETSLQDAQIEKIDRICRKLELKPDHHVIEIGTGWGAFALHAAKHYGCRVSTTTISKNQFEMTKKRIMDAGLQDRIQLLYQDYRKLEGTHDRLVSIEMIEAVGLDHLDEFISKCSSLLKPEGSALLQAITIREESYETAKRSVDFIQRYIFPGSGICSIGSIQSAVARNTDLSLSHLEDFGTHYARTLREWSKALQANHKELVARGYSEELYRMWQFYFSYCEGGFLERSIGVAQMLYTKPRSTLTDPVWYNSDAKANR
ncbi:MAG: cyclopropane-fatty-acyl-phospholipid synthase family protein [Bdellovibrionales bacterium]|nr:cyclopropane-fatty-acyl-phospholipid synthase family protein [Bdellovibrionales bacterium]